MAELIYSAITSLDGFVADKDGNFDWAEPDEQVHSFINALMRPAAVHLYGRRMYEIMTAWETLDTDNEPACIAEFAAQWRAAEKVVYSATLQGVSTSRTRLERRFDPEAIRRMKASAPGEIGIGGPTIAARAFESGLVDTIHLFIAPVLVGDGKRALPVGGFQPLSLRDERRFPNGMVYLQYRVLPRPSA